MLLQCLLAYIVSNQICGHLVFVLRYVMCLFFLVAVKIFSLSLVLSNWIIIFYGIFLNFLALGIYWAFFWSVDLKFSLSLEILAILSSHVFFFFFTNTLAALPLILPPRKRWQLDLLVPGSSFTGLDFSEQGDNCIEPSTLHVPPSLFRSFALFLQYNAFTHRWSVSGKPETFRMGDTLLES